MSEVEKLDIKIDGRNTVNLYSQRCLNCYYLLGTSDSKVRNSCHYDKGNEWCPAKEMKITFTGNISKKAANLAKALKSGDPAKIQEAMRAVSKLDKEDSMKIMQQALKEAAKD